MSEMTVALRLLLDGRNFDGGVVNSGRGLSRFGALARREINSLRSAWNSTQGQLAKAGIGFGGFALLRQSARLDQSLNQVRQTAGGTRAEVRGLRGDLFSMTRDSGRDIEGLRGGFNNLIAAGLQWKQALTTIRAINPASVVSGADEATLAGGLTVASAAYRFDLAEPGMATKLLDQMVVAGRLGNAELEDLASIFSRVGVNAKGANLEFNKTLGFIEGLSLLERNPERLATLADSTLRLFTNDKYKKAAAKATGVKFYGADGSARDPFDVLADISKGYQSKTTDQARDRYIAKAFGETDLDTQRGLKALLAPGALDQIRVMSEQIANAGGTVKRDLAEAMDNAVNQAGRVRSIFSKVGDELAQPINRRFADLVDKAVRPKSEGGYELSGGQMIGLGVGGVVAGALAKSAATALLRRIPIVGRALGDTASTAAGVAQGKALQEAAGVTPVFVTNWPGSTPASGPAAAAETALAAAGGASLVTRLGSLLGALPGVSAMSGLIAANGLGLTAGAALAGGALGYGAGTLIYKGVGLYDDALLADTLGKALAKVFGGVESGVQPAENVNGRIEIQIDETGRPRVGAITASGGLDLNVATGMTVFGSPP